MGLVLEWVYGTIVSTAEKARDSAKKPLGKLLSPTTSPAVEWACGNIASCTVAGVLWTWLHSMASQIADGLGEFSKSMCEGCLIVLRRPAPAFA